MWSLVMCVELDEWHDYTSVLRVCGAIDTDSETLFRNENEARGRGNVTFCSTDDCTLVVPFSFIGRSNVYSVLCPIELRS
jgi:hypothetical protein